MPILMPTPDEMSRMSHAQRAKARRALWAIIRDTDQHLEQQQQQLVDAAQFGQHVLDQARALEHTEPRDSPTDIIARRIDALCAFSTDGEAVGTRRRLTREAVAYPIAAAPSATATSDNDPTIQ